jgi:hypothetical protein
MLLASFTSGLIGEAGKFTSFNSSANINEVLKIATTVNQPQIQEGSNEIFYVDEPRTRRVSGRAFSGLRRNSKVRHEKKNAEASRTQRQNRKGPTQEIRETART